MGNSASKKARLEQLERDCAQATSSLTDRDEELARAEKGLKHSKGQEEWLSGEVDSLKKKLAELSSLSKTLEQEQEKQIVKLQADL